LLLQIRLELNELNELNEAIVHDFTSINVSVLRSLSPLDKIWR